MKFYVIPVGHFTMPDKGHLTPGSGVGTPIYCPVYCYLIEHERGPVLVDTGEQPDAIADIRDGEDIVSRLQALGYAPGDIDYVVMTHLHVDHTGYMTAFPEATFVVREEELRAAWWPSACEKGYVYAHYRDTRDYRYLQIPDDVDFDLFGDGKVVLIDTRGHTRGHQSLVLRLEQAGRMVIVGDAASLRENLDAMIQPGVCTDNWAAIRSLQKLQILEMQGCTLLFGHEPAQEGELRMAPAYYE